ncbi:MAG TPA: Asp-tRNA(Asn)/Glu-tRNA(Gln) amidotransferase subunit GatC [Candidatus Moranbacteria bacterium]|nr:Asp-tRNA(Asn)/Glu-tRNA(Gln) amidotransferase subunit GatC [Candidatus Moranbacteria bacterium]
MTNKIISREEVEKTAQLARLDLTEEEKDHFASDLNSTLDYFKSFSDVDGKVIEKVSINGLMENQLREDELLINNQEEQEEEKKRIKDSFPQANGDYLKVKSVL